MGVLDTGLARYFSGAQLAALGAARIGIIGAGGLGSNIALLLARSGVKHFFIADHDIVDASNLNRQVYMPEDVGRPKVLALSRHLLSLDPALCVVVNESSVTRANAVTLCADCPIVIEAVDNAETKAMLYEVFARSKDFYVTASGLAGYGFSEEYAMTCRRLRHNVVAVGDFFRGVNAENPPLAPRVMQAAAMQADAVLSFILSPVSSRG